MASRTKLRRETGRRRRKFFPLWRVAGWVVLGAIYDPWAGFAQVTLSEILFDPATSDNTDEFVEIVNLNEAQSVSLEGWRLGDGESSDALVDAGGGLVLRPGQYAVILDGDYFASSMVYEGVIPTEALILTINGTTLGNVGLSNSRSETVTLRDAQGNVISSCRYTLGNREGYSEEKIRLNAGDGTNNWMDGQTPGGTPGRVNSVSICVEVSKMSCEIRPNPFSPDGDGVEDVTEIQYRLPGLASRLTVMVFSLSGRRVRDLANGIQSGSEGVLTWDGKDHDGSVLPQGIYIVVLKCQSVTDGSVGQYKDTIVLAR